MGVLDGIRILDLGRYIACPYCCLLLADMGAEVIKVERVGTGEDCRVIGPYKNGQSLYVPTFNRNKKGVTLQFRQEKGKELFRRLIKESDVIVENFRPGTMEKMGFGWEKVHKINPKIVMASISGFGQTGPESGRACVDVVALALSGLMSVTGTEESGPMIVGTQVADHVASMVCALSIMSALYDREKTGQGQYIDTSLIECLVPMLQTIVPDYVANGTMSGLHGNTDVLSTPSDRYKAQDGYVIMFAGLDPLYNKLADALGIEEMKEERFSTAEKRNKNKKEIESIVANWISGKEAGEVEKIFTDAGIPCAKVANIKDVVNNKQLNSRGVFVNIDVPDAGEATFVASPVRMSAHPDIHYNSAPRIGEHNKEIYQGLLGLSDEEMAQLEAEKTI